MCNRLGVLFCYFSQFMAYTAYSTISNVLGIRMRNQGAGYVSHVCVSQAQAAQAKSHDATRQLALLMVSAPLVYILPSL